MSDLAASKRKTDWARKTKKIIGHDPRVLADVLMKHRAKGRQVDVRSHGSDDKRGTQPSWSATVHPRRRDSRGRYA